MRYGVVFLGLLGFVQSNAQTITLTEEVAWKKVPLAGYVEAEQDRVLVTNRMAEIIELPVRQGERVQQGTVLVRLEDKALQQQRKALKEAQLARKGAVAQAELQVERMTRLAQKGAVATVQQEAAELELKASRAKLGEVLAQQQQVEEMQSYLVITANAEGQLTELNVSLGDTAMPGQSLGRFVTSGVRTLKVLVPDHLYGYLEEARWEVKAGGSSDWQTTELTAKTATPEQRTSSYRVYLGVPEGSVPNQRVDVNLLLPLKGMFIPNHAVDQRGNLSYVWVRKKSEDRRRLVKLGLPLPDGRRLVLGGLALGERIVIKGAGHD